MGPGVVPGWYARGQAGVPLPPPWTGGTCCLPLRSIPQNQIFPPATMKLSWKGPVWVRIGWGGGRHLVTVLPGGRGDRCAVGGDSPRGRRRYGGSPPPPNLDAPHAGPRRVCGGGVLPSRVDCSSDEQAFQRAFPAAPPARPHEQTVGSAVPPTSARAPKPQQKQSHGASSVRCPGENGPAVSMARLLVSLLQ